MSDLPILEARLEQLQQDYSKGRDVVEQMRQAMATNEAVLLRLQGAIAVLKEMIAESKERQKPVVAHKEEAAG